MKYPYINFTFFEFIKSLFGRPMCRKYGIDYLGDIEHLNGKPYLYLYIDGSNEWLDWFYNFLGLLPFWPIHPGYWIKAKKLNKLLKYLYEERGVPLVLIGHSHGAGVVGAYFYRYVFKNNPKATARPVWTCALACPATFHWLVARKLRKAFNKNKAKPNPLDIFVKSDDLILSSLLLFTYKLPLNVTHILNSGRDARYKPLMTERQYELVAPHLLGSYQLSLWKWAEAKKLI